MIRNHLTSLFLSFMYGPSIPDPLRLTLERESAKWFRGVWISGIVVALGCMAEIWEVTFDLRNWRRARKNSEPLKDNPGSWMYPLAAFGLLLVVGGIVSETIFEVLDANVESQLRAHASDVISDSESKAAEADQRAADAEGRAKALDQSTQQLKTNEAIAKREAEREKLKRSQIEARVAWRHLTEKQEADIASVLGNFSNQEGASFWFENGDTEAEMFASDVAKALRMANIVVQPPAGMITMRESGRFGDPIKPADTGVILQSTKDLRSLSLAEAIIKELNSRGFDAKRQTDPPFDDKPLPQVWVNVEPRPEGPQGEYKLQAIEDARKKNAAKSTKKSP